MEALLSREQFKQRVLALKGGRCLFCAEKAVDPHHIIERKLFDDGGYYLSNGAPVCDKHHWDCETTKISVETIRSKLEQTEFTLPTGFATSESIDKWGNVIRADGMREPGPLFTDHGARKALAAGGYLGLFVPKGELPC